MITNYIVGYETSSFKDKQKQYWETIIEGRTVEEVREKFYSEYNKKNVKIVRIAHDKTHKSKDESRILGKRNL